MEEEKASQFTLRMERVLNIRSEFGGYVGKNKTIRFAMNGDEPLGL